MFELGILNTLIAMVIVILVLSLIVQSVQTLVKKVLKLKSRTILNSLEDLFETITERGVGAELDPASFKTPQQLVKDVTDRLREMGRETLRGKPMLDSLAKGDLLKVLTRVTAEDLLPGSVRKFQTVLSVIGHLKTELDNIKVDLLERDASAKFAALQSSLMPFVHDVEALAGDGNINPKVLFGDLYRLRQIKEADVLEILGQIQQRVGEDVATQVAANDAAQKALADVQQRGDATQIEAALKRVGEQESKLTSVQGVSDSLKRIAEQISALGKTFDAAFAPLRERLGQAESWYDTVMQGFEERYTRHMRTVAIIISIVVVVVLNANFFTVYRAIAADSVKAAALAAQGQEILEQSRQLMVQSGADSGAPPSASTSPSAGDSPQSSPATETQVTVADLKMKREQVAMLTETYKAFGIAPLTREQFSNVFAGKVSAGAIGDTLLGWAIMVMLLSAGAPFWQDTLESLFGLKNLLRQKSATKNVEEEKGGQPKP